MFLAIKEMSYSKLRYTLVIGIILLISYAVFMLSGLANGLATDFRQAVTDWNSEGIILSEDSNKNLVASQLSQKNLADVSIKEKAPLSIYSGAIDLSGEKLDITLFGTINNAFLLPKPNTGRVFNKKGEIIISENLADKGIKLNDKITVGNDNLEMTVVGIFPKTSYLVSPVIYASLEDVTLIKYGKDSKFPADELPINGIVTAHKSPNISKNASPTLQLLETNEYIENLPGYAAQNLTLNAMIYFLFIIVTAIIGIFMYVMTLQKTSIFGVMKAQGISNTFIIKSIINQSLMVGIIGIILGFTLSYLTSFILPETMPFSISLNLWLIYSGILLIVTVIGSLFSIRTVTKVDPMKAIGG